MKGIDNIVQVNNDRDIKIIWDENGDEMSLFACDIVMQSRCYPEKLIIANGFLKMIVIFGIRRKCIFDRTEIVRFC